MSNLPQDGQRCQPVVILQLFQSKTGSPCGFVTLGSCVHVSQLPCCWSSDIAEMAPKTCLSPYMMIFCDPHLGQGGFCVWMLADTSPHLAQKCGNTSSEPAAMPLPYLTSFKKPQGQFIDVSIPICYPIQLAHCRPIVLFEALKHVIPTASEIA